MGQDTEGLPVETGVPAGGDIYLYDNPAGDKEDLGEGMGSRVV